MPTDLRCEYRVNPIGIDNVQPRLSWKMVDEAETRGQKQTAFQILVSSSLQKLNADQGDLWDTKKQVRSKSVNNVYKGKPLTSGQNCFWKVRIWDIAGKDSQWSKAARFTIGLLHPDDWKGAWIQKEDQTKMDHIWYRKNFTLSDSPTSGLVYVASLGYHELYVNGEKITDSVMNPASSYLKTRVPYLTYDVSDKLRRGDNVIGVWHAAGWTRWTRIREHRNPPFTFKAQAQIETNEDSLTLSSDESWKCKNSSSKYVGKWDIQDFGGEIIDARKLEPNWCAASYDDSAWSNAIVASGNTPPLLSAQMVEPQVKYDSVLPVAVTEGKEEGTYLIDMGTNYSGWFEIKLRNGTAGETVTFQISDIKGVVCNKNQISKYVFNESGEGVFCNRFNLAGGRWYTVSGLSYKPELEDIKGYVITSDRKQISRFECSSDLLNQIYAMNIKTYLANTLDGILMDCPHRERRGWGEVTVAAMYGDAFPNFESGAYMDQYMQYMKDAQFPDGRTRAIINEEDRCFLMWQANNPLTIWETYRFFGDKKILADNYESMEKWMTWILDHSDYANGGSLIAGEEGKREFPGLGDWATPHGNDFSSCNAPDAVHFNNCLYAHMLEIAERIATELGEAEDAAKYADRLKVQRQATHANTYDSETGNYRTGRQVDQAYALFSGVTPEPEKQKVYENLVDKILYGFPYYDVGSSGQALFTRYFIEVGERMDLIYELLTDTRHPSYSYFIEQGETTWPELWSSSGPSRIHTCYTGIGGYFIMGFGGIRVDPEHYGFQHFLIKPAVVDGLTYANTSYESLYGKIVNNWKTDGKTATFHLEIPANTTAKVFIPATNPDVVKEGSALASEAPGVEYVGVEESDVVGQYVIYQVGAGVFDFTSTDLPQVNYPPPKYQGPNIALIGRATASSMTMKDAQNPSQEAFRANDDDMQTLWMARNSNDQWLEVEWMQPQTVNKVFIHEVGNHITSHAIEYLNGSDWTQVADGDDCGSNKVHEFEAVTSKRIRLLIETASKVPSIAEFQIYKP
ncbi:family 78 glycoside hydrolase catalytic domain [Rubripirellula obstinata]|nr:family 78 glycoside hydrolase catalytic domain [Rubripirellula obstinata]